jgi:hypothetical protein
LTTVRDWLTLRHFIRATPNTLSSRQGLFLRDMIYRKLLVLEIWLALCILASPVSYHAQNADLRDFMVQDVCVHEGIATNIDPSQCPTESGWIRRDLSVGEELPYHKFDQWGAQISDSFPLRLPDGTLRYVNTLEFSQASGDSKADAPLEFNFEITIGGTFYKSLDGWNINEAEGDFASIIGTRDPTGGTQTFWAQDCRFDDSWILFPTSVTRLVAGSVVARLRIAQTCPQSFDAAYTQWDLIDSPRFTYTSGKSLITLASWHYGGESMSTADHIEMFFFTREYGLTRWERWQRGGTPKAIGCNGDPSYQGFGRADCRDWTYIQSDPNGGYSPYNIPIDSRFVPNNLLVNGDFGRGHLTEDENWSRISASSTMQWYLIQDDPGASNVYGRNHHLAFSCSDCAGDSIYQNVPRITMPRRAQLMFGGMIWSDSPGQIDASLLLLDVDGVVRQQRKTTLNTGPLRKRFEDKIRLEDETITQFRFALMPNSPNTVFRADNLWLVQIPRLASSEVTEEAIRQRQSGSR